MQEINATSLEILASIVGWSALGMIHRHTDQLHLKDSQKLLHLDGIPEWKIPTAVIGIAAHQGKPVVLWKPSSKLIALPMGPDRSTTSVGKLVLESDISARFASSGFALAWAVASEVGLVRSVSAAFTVVDAIQAA